MCVYYVTLQGHSLPHSRTNYQSPNCRPLCTRVRFPTHPRGARLTFYTLPTQKMCIRKREHGEAQPHPGCLQKRSMSMRCTHAHVCTHTHTPKPIPCHRRGRGQRLFPATQTRQGSASRCPSPGTGYISVQHCSFTARERTASKIQLAFHATLVCQK